MPAIVVSVRVTGLNHFGEKTAETISGTAAATPGSFFTTETAWSRIDSIVVISNTGVAGDTLTFGITGNTTASGRIKFGIPCKIPSTGMLKKVIQQDLTNLATTDITEVQPGDITLAPYYTFVLGATASALQCHGFLDPDMFEL